MKTRWLWVWICLVLGLVLLGGGLMVPAHLRAVDSSVVLSAGRTGDSLLDRGKDLVSAGRVGAAEMYAAAARLAGMPGWDRLAEAVTNRAAREPGASYWGTDTRVEKIFHSRPEGNSFSAFIVQRENREAALAVLAKSPSASVQELLRCRGLDHTVLLPAASSPAGQAFEAVLAETGLLLDGHRLTPPLSRFIDDQARQATGGGNSQPLEQVLIDFGSLGEHLNWDQLTALVVHIPDAATLHQLADQMSEAGDRLPLLFVAVQLSGAPEAVARYDTEFPKTGLQDTAAALWYGGNGVKELTESGRRFYMSGAARWVAAHTPLGGLYYLAADRSLQNPWLVLGVKWLLYLGAGFCFAAALHFSRPVASGLETPLQVRGFHLIREFLFSLGFLLVVLLLSEPFLAQESQKEGFSFRLHLPMTGGAIPAGVAGLKQTLMNPINPTVWLTLLVFFVLQALLYVSCLVKLAEIRRQQVPPRMKIKLLENEEHLFDAGLYLGFVGTIISLIIASTGHVRFSLMAAYSSTSFGIIFVVIFKIFHLRPARRKLLLEAELAEATAALRPARATVPTPALTS
ncbi:MAG TPA: hypothetical protein VL970_08770 [Candidatus Acidoferrales bacterium]|nr:hypothetical protein [Candidatus Acidoferrales bacterium]